tara:strand:- start:18384 stop:18710 length:327 start_codon:yes stop_codon:yes gene_type:complete
MKDYNTRTVSGAAAHAAKYAEPYDPHEGWDGSVDVPPPDLDEVSTTTWEELYQYLHKLEPHQRKGRVNIVLDPDTDEVYQASGVAVACEVAEHLWDVEKDELILCVEM